MTTFQFKRKGTVSKSSGPVHVYSYALKGVPIKYTPPFFLPDQQTLPPSWRPPTQLTDDLFRYDYSRERKVLEQARVRTMSLAAEAQAREKREHEEEERRRIEAAAVAERAQLPLAQLPPPLIPSPMSTILTPTPAPRTITTIASTSTTGGAHVNKDNSTSTTNKDTLNVIKPLGELSLSEFEDNNFNPFDAASLQAINDMEVLQTISLLPVPGTNSPAPPPPPSPSCSAHVSAASSQGQTVVTNTRPLATVAASNHPNVLPNAGSVSGAPVPIQFSGPQTLPPIGTPRQPPIPQIPPRPSQGVPSHSPQPSPPQIPASTPNLQQIVSAPVHGASLPTLPVLPPIGANLTHSHSEPTNTKIDVAPPVLVPRTNNPSTSTQPPPANPLTAIPVQPTVPVYPARPAGTVSSPTINPSHNPSLPPPTSHNPSLPPPTSHNPSLPPPTSHNPSLPPPTSHNPPPPSPTTAAGIAGPPQPPVPVPRHPFTPYPTLPQPPNMPAQPLPHPGPAQNASPSTNPFLPQQQQQSAAVVGGPSASGAGGVGTLVNLGDETAPPTVVAASSSQATPTQTPPVPKPRTFKNTPVAGQQPPNSALPPYSAGPSPLPHPSTVAPKPPPGRSSVQSRANTIMASLSQGQAAGTRPGLGVPVLPPISSPSPPQPPTRGHSSPSLTSSAFSPPGHPPPPFPTPHLPSPPYTEPAPPHSNSPPPPYYSESRDMDIRRFSQPAPLPSQSTATSVYTLPDPQVSLSAKEEREVASIAGMGFPTPRVARAVKRFNSDRSKVLDFLILVGGVEESTGVRGDSAETALTVCSDDETKAVRYLQKVGYYKESGFSERNIHKAYEKAGKDWDRALDILTQQNR